MYFEHSFNSMQQQSSKSILLRLSLHSRRQWTTVPMTESAIARVEQIAAEEHQPWVQSTGLIVEWRPNDPFNDDDDPDYVYTPDVDAPPDDDDFTYDEDEYASDDDTVITSHLSDADLLTLTPSEPSRPASRITNQDAMSVPTHVADAAPNHTSTSSTVSHLSASVDSDHSSISSDSSPDLYNTDDLFDHPDGFLDSDTFTAPDAPPAPRYSLRPNRARTYGHRLANIMDTSTHSKTYDNPTTLLQQSTNNTVTAYVLTQMSVCCQQDDQR
jgi:hypothetical protein